MWGLRCFGVGIGYAASGSGNVVALAAPVPGRCRPSQSATGGAFRAQEPFSHGARFHQASCALIQKAPRDLASEVRIALSKPFRFAYIQPAASCGYGDKRRRNKLFGPGGGTRRLHLSPASIMRCADFGGGGIGSTGSVKGALLLGMVPPSSGRFYSCQRQLCSGGSRRVMR